MAALETPVAPHDHWMVLMLCDQSLGARGHLQLQLMFCFSLQPFLLTVLVVLQFEPAQMAQHLGDHFVVG